MTEKGDKTDKMDLNPIRVFISSTSVNYEVKQEQQRALFILESKKIPFETVDISLSKAKARIMRVTVGDSAANPPRFFKGEIYLGGFKEFMEAVDEERLEHWLKLSLEEATDKKGENPSDFVHENPKRYEQLKRRLDTAMKLV